MPQLDIYIVCNLIFSVILLIIIIYICNTLTTLLRINLSLRLNFLQKMIQKKSIFKILEENGRYRRFIYMKLLLKRAKSFTSLFKKSIFNYDILDIKIKEKKILLKNIKHKLNNLLKNKIKKYKNKKK